MSGGEHRRPLTEIEQLVKRLTHERDDARREAADYGHRLDTATMAASVSYRDAMSVDLAYQRSANLSLATDVDRLTRALAERDEAQRELAEIKRVLSDYHQQVGTGILAVKKLAKRIYEQTAGGTRRPAESPADYPAVATSPAAGISFADLPDDARPPDFLRPGFGTGNVTVKTEAEEAGP